MNLNNAIYQGMLKAWDRRKEEEAEKAGTYRAGNSGILLDGTAAGQCNRRALARFLGYEKEIDYDIQLMFDVGELNETRWQNYLELAGYEVKKDATIEWTTAAGTKVTGRLDMVLVKDGVPVHAIEHKHVSSLNTALAAVTGKPKLEHLAQAGHYSMHSPGLSFSLVYTNSTNIEGPEWKMNQLPKPGELNSECINYTYYKYTGEGRTVKGKRQEFKKVIEVAPEDSDLYPSEIMKKYGADFAVFKSFRPFVIQFPLRWVGKSLEYYDGNDWTTTIVTSDNIREYYESLDTMQREKRLSPRPYTLDAQGESYKWSLCNYCELRPNCNAHETNYTKWVQSLHKK